MKANDQLNNPPEPQLETKKNWFSNRISLRYVYLAVILLVILILFKGFIVRLIHKDNSGRIDLLVSAFLRKSDSDATTKIRFPQGTIRLVFTSGQQELFYKKIGLGEETEKKLTTPSDTKSGVNNGSSIYVAYPYLFQIRAPKTGAYDTTVMIYDLEENTYEYSDLDNCRGVHTNRVAYDAGKIYWHQFKEWSTCTGNYKKNYKLDKPVVDSTNLPVPPEYKLVKYQNTKYGYEFIYPETAVVVTDKDLNNGPKLSQHDTVISLADKADFAVSVYIIGESDYYLHNIENIKAEQECYAIPLGGKAAWQCNNPRSSPDGLPTNSSYHFIFTEKYIYQIAFKEGDWNRPDHADLMDKTNKIYRSLLIY